MLELLAVVVLLWSRGRSGEPSRDGCVGLSLSAVVGPVLDFLWPRARLAGWGLFVNKAVVT